ncbi:hypothetical protein [Capillimicrobium parvum]|uniref:Uncharacterized protein n=1 Tax=Capillimicrobium parvum TaxID=2884022 RepID=A0A9E6XYG9_9ACTN|nr:hypothetical protein [Capillimicrobium parvum]UGS36785.1 hypothetical protein DSM104329_03196 [Capillimicrobium parvum]
MTGFKNTLCIAGATIVMLGAASGAAHAAPPPIAPQGDDVGYLQFAAVAERVNLTYLRDMRDARWLRPAERALVVKAIAAKRSTTMQLELELALGADAPQPGGYVAVFPKNALRTRHGGLERGVGLQRLIVQTLVGGAPFVADPGTRLLLTRVVSADTAQLSMLHRLTGDRTVGGLPAGVDLDVAGQLLDRYLSQPDAPDQENLP